MLYQVAIANFYEEEHSVDEGSAANPLDVDEFDEEEEPQPINIKPSKKTPKAKNSRWVRLEGDTNKTSAN